MVFLTFSNALEPLTTALARDIGAWRAGNLDRLLGPLPIAVPDRLVARYLDLAIARALGASVNLRFPFLSGLFEACLSPALRERLLTRDRIIERIVVALGDAEFLAAPEMAPLRTYLATNDPQSSARRRTELAQELGRLYLEYAATRPREFCGDFEFASGESAWQRQLWQRIRAPIPGEAPDAPRPATLVELLLGASDDDLEVPPALFVVGGSTTAPAHRLILDRLGRRSEVRVYAFNACREFWEDLARTPDECPALAYWGRAGRAPARLLGELVDFNFESGFVEPAADTVLDRIKGDVLERRPRQAREKLAHDASIRILSAPTVRRELEHIGEAIWSLARADSSLSLTDVGVLLAGSDKDLYRAQIGSVFGQLARLPHHISLVPLTEESRVTEATSELLALALGSFTRPEMLRVLTHPSIAGVDADIDPADWVRWARELGVFFGQDAGAHRGTYIEGDVYHWDQALLRLSLGICVEASAEPMVVASRTVVPHALAPEQRRSAGRLARLARALCADIGWLRAQSRSLAAWGEVLWRYVNSYVAATTDREHAELGRCRGAILGIGDPSLDAAVPLTCALELARAALAALETRRGEPLAHGVCVAPLSGPPLVPFRHLFIAGLSSGAFPAADRAGIDARSSAPQATEPSAQDRDRFAFLHAILCARESVTLSYVGRDAVSGESLPPSSVVAEFLSLAAREVADRGWLSVEIPAAAYRDSEVEARAVNVSGRLAAQVARLAPRRGLRQRKRSRRRVLEQLRDSADRRTREILGLASQPRGSSARDHEISTAELANFLDGPIDAWGSTVLGLGQVEESERMSANEPLDLTRLSRSIIMREAVCGLAIEGERGGDLEQRVARAAARQLASGTGPSGRVAAWQVAAALDGASAWWRGLATVTVEAPTSLAIGRARANLQVREILPAVILGDDPFIELHGQFPLVSADGSVAVYFHTKDSMPADRPGRAVIDHLLLAASGRCTAPTATVHIIGKKSKVDSIEIRAFSGDEARAYLESLALELSAGEHAYELPGSQVLLNALRGRAVLADLEEHSRRLPPPYKMTVERGIGDYELPRELDLIVARRYAPLFERMRSLS